ncbi:MAG TPA: hypothetical protein VMR97_14665 [Acidimicrobiales bacterium]|nr:hypothetical protein [Acidimicrobiales bacterium]
MFGGSWPVSGAGARNRLQFALGSVLAGLVSLVFLLWMVLVVGGPRMTDLVDDIGELVAAVIAAALCALAASRASSRRTSWILLAVSSFAWAVGEAIWCYYDLVERVQVPFPSYADIGFVTAIPFMFAGLLLFPCNSRRTAARIEGLLDGCIIAGSLLFASWATILGPIYRSHSGGVLKQVLSLTYPASDVVMLSLVLILIARAGHHRRTAFGLVMFGVVAFAVADSSFAYLTEVNKFGIGSYFDTGWVAGYLLIALGALWDVKSPARAVVRADPSTTSLIAPYVPVLIVLVVTAVQILRGSHVDAVTWVMAVVLVVLVLGREGLRLRDQAVDFRSRSSHASPHPISSSHAGPGPDPGRDRDSALVER